MIQVFACIALNSDATIYRASESAERKCINFSGWSSERKKVDGEWKPVYTWVDCSYWVPANSSIEKLCTAGSTLCVSGTVALDVYMSKKTGQPAAKMKILVEKLQPAPQSAQKANISANEYPLAENSDSDKDTPF